MDSLAPDISVVVPVLNEASELPGLIGSLAGQEGVVLELLLCDGGSDDGSQEIAAGLAAGCNFPVRLLQTGRGRGRQMNAGVNAATSEILLFLHADSRFEERAALQTALHIFRNRETSGDHHPAGRFRLRFRRSCTAPSLAYAFYEAKARLPRPDCIRGDQGFLLTRTTLTRAGGFDESLPFLEDIRLVEATRGKTEWLLFPSSLSTSARRFEREGLRERHVVNAVIVNCIATGWTELFTALPELYSCNAESGRIMLAPFLAGIRGLINSHERTWRREFWNMTGHHAAANAWQLFFWLDVRRAFLNGAAPDKVELRWYNICERYLTRFFGARPAALCAELLTRIWVRWITIKGTSRTG